MGFESLEARGYCPGFCGFRAEVHLFECPQPGTLNVLFWFKCLDRHPPNIVVASYPLSGPF